MELTSLLERLGACALLVRSVGIADGMRASALAMDSRQASPGSIFVAIRGTSSDGHMFIDKAVNNGAIAVVCEAVPEGHERAPGTAFIEVSDARAALAEAAALFYEDPSAELRIVGVTGTNGKTTTAFLVHHLLNDLGTRTGLIGTVLLDLGGDVESSTLTTPDAVTLQRSLRTMRRHGCSACAMEVSSHALHQNRVRSVDFDVAVFTNLTTEHLDYHGTLDAYLQAKKLLFDSLDPSAVALANEDDPSTPKIVADTQGRVVTYGRSAEADIRMEVEENTVRGLQMRIDGTRGRFQLVGLFNAYNLAAAYGAGQALGYEQAAVIEALERAAPVPGRFEQLGVSKNRTVVVDYAHTPDALQNVLETASALRPEGSKLWCVFGCGGDRDRSKRPVMGAIAERHADYLIVTSDNPRKEDPEAIMDEIRGGMARPERARWIVDRREAISAAAESSAPGDVVVIAGKGHETYQIIGSERTPFDDRAEAQIAFAV